MTIVQNSFAERLRAGLPATRFPTLPHRKADKLVAIFHNRRLLARMNKPKYVEPAIGWNDEDDKAGVIKYGVANFEPRKSE